MMNDTTNPQLLLKEIAEKLGNDYLLAQTPSSELVQYPTPITASLLEKVFSYDGSLGLAYRELDLPIVQYTTREYFHYFMGRVYFNLQVEDRYFWPHFGFTHTVNNGELKVEQHLPFFQKIGKSVKQAAIQSLIVAKQQEIVNEAVALCNTLESTQRFPADQLYDENMFLAELESFVAEYKTVIKLAYLESILGDNYKSIKIIAACASRDKYIESVDALATLSVSELPKFLDTFGNRSFNDFELSKARWYEVPEVLAKLAAQSEGNENVKRKSLETPAFIILKNNVRYCLLNRIARIRQLICALGRKSNMADDVFYMTIDEILDHSKIGNQELQSRKESYELAIKQFVPQFLYPDMSDEDWQINSQLAVNAMPVSAGVGTGKCIVVSQPEIVVTEKSILVLPTAGPEFTHLYASAAAIIFLQGGVLSHGSIIAREMKVPAVIATRFTPAKDMLNSKITVDGTKGKITQL